MYPLQKLILTRSQAADGLFPLSFLVKKKMTELQLIAPNTVELVDPLCWWHTM